MNRRARTVAGVVAALFVLALSALWVFGRETGQPGTVRAQGSSPSFLASWPPVGRAMLWLAAGAAAVGFDLLVVRPHSETDRGKDLVLAFAVVTGLAFALFAVATLTDRI